MPCTLSAAKKAGAANRPMPALSMMMRMAELWALDSGSEFSMIVTVTLCLAGALSSNALNAASPGGDTDVLGSTRFALLLRHLQAHPVKVGQQGSRHCRFGSGAVCSIAHGRR